MLRTSDILPEQLREWNENVQFNPVDLELFEERENRSQENLLKTSKYIANASNSSGLEILTSCFETWM